jgi:hypothetical protein
VFDCLLYVRTLFVITIKVEGVSVEKLVEDHFLNVHLLFALKFPHVIFMISRAKTPTALLYPLATFNGLTGTPCPSTHVIT